ncbi:hypothetical protein [Modestobacter sp. VKM Ac-2985]|uniref:hypothetical protein n=1 Tax=Modestobacter sp. VKM Ac-2985 TaxID=3004139 RepID=UPI0022AB64A2|nr:hypothetical protein [Modestobacter sp. VKM Ac-2985]MCZ2836096.1 hypothetical protein [Modestobacter sp. VKM Ac-2985]
MRTSRLPAALLPLLVVPALLSGCSSDGSATTAASTPSAPSSSASSTAPATTAGSADTDAQETFCTEVPGLLTDITTDLQGATTTPEQAPQQVAEAVDRLATVEPPAGVTPQWERLVAAWTSMRDLMNQVDVTDRAANADLAPQLQALQTELVEAGSAVDEYGKTTC